MANSPEHNLGIDDERFDDLFDTMEIILKNFFKEALARDNIEADDEDIDAESETTMGFMSVLLVALDAQILSTSQSKNGDKVYDVKLTAPSGDIQAVVQRVLEILEVDKEL